MNKNKQLYLGIAVAVTTGLLVFLSFKKKKAKTKIRLHQVSEEGYETAHDVLYPLRIKRLKSGRAF